MMKKEELAFEISQILLLDNKDVLDDTYKLRENVLWDSLAVMSTIVVVEKIYQVVLNEEDISNCLTFGDLSELALSRKHHGC